MSAAMLVRFETDKGVRVGVLSDGHVADLTDAVGSVADWLRASAGRVQAAIDELAAAAQPARRYELGPDPFAAPMPGTRRWLAPVDSQEVWGAGVTYLRSRDARQEEAVDGGDIYARVYGAERPELFFKAPGWRVVGPGGEVGIRADATWSVPEPELTLLLNPALEVVGMTIANDMSSRDIEGLNPLYLSQAKIYTGSCALGPGVVAGALAEWPPATIRLTIEREGTVAFAGEVGTDRIHRRIPELLDYLGRSNVFPEGVALMTGTGIVPPADFTLAAGDVVRIAVDGIGELVNTVKVV